MLQIPTLLFLTSVIAAAIVAGLAVWIICRRRPAKVVTDDSDSLKLEYLTFLTNKIRTPMTLISTPLQKLTRNSYGEEADNELMAMKKNAAKVVELLDRTLELDRIGSDGRDLSFREINLVKYLSNLQSLFNPQAKRSDIEMSFHCDKDRIPVWIDRSVFDEILMTVYSRALKYTPAGGKIDIELTSDNKYAALVIKNNGEQIPDYILRNLFGLFAISESGTVLGTNMDYYLVKEVVNLHKGTVTVENLSDPDGVVRTIKLPLGHSHLPKNQLSNRKDMLEETWRSIDPHYDSKATDQTVHSVSGKGFSIIGIDESADICAYLQAMLNPVFNVTTYTSPTEGLKAVITELPDLVIAEVMMQEIDGFTLVKQLKNSPNTSHIPILLLTAIPGEDVRVQGLMTGADAIISKPFNEEELILNCHNLIKSRSRLASHIKEMQSVKDAIHPIDIQSNNDALMKNILEVINKNISNPDLNVEMIAEAIGLSRGHLHRRIKEITGSAPGEYIRTIRMNQAAQMLKGPKKSISAIAYSVGYNSASVFSTAFRTFFGISAKDYQNQFAETAIPAPEAEGSEPEPESVKES